MSKLIGEKVRPHLKLTYQDKDTILFPLGTPQSTHFDNVRSRYSVEDWNLIRRSCYRKAKYKCEICNESGVDQGYKHPVECHEIWDWDFDSKTQKLVGLISLCPRCHKIVHISLTQILYEKGEITATEYSNIMNHFKNVNKLQGDGETLVTRVMYQNMDFHTKKHKINWKVDTSYADRALKNILKWG